VDTLVKYAGLVVAGFCLAVVIGLLQAVPVWLLWNWLMPVLFEVPKVTFLQALGLSILAGCLFQSHSSSSK
jgi:hypothetical protein